MAKPIVHYTDAWYVEVGHSARISGVLDHYRPDNINPGYAHHLSYVTTTSKVVSHNAATDDFETLNTRYVKVARPNWEEVTPVAFYDAHYGAAVSA